MYSSLVSDFDRLKKKVVKSWMEVARKKKLQIGEEEARIVMETSVTGNELTVSVVEGHKTSFLYGYGEIASGLGFKPGDEGKVAAFNFDYMSPEAFERAKKSASRLSNKTINGMMKGDKSKFARRNVRNIIKDGIKTGKADTDIANSIGKFFDDSKYWKASEITRTEIPLAYNYGRIDAARTDGLKKARIYLGGRPCQWCIDNHGDVTTLDEAEAYMNAHHPINDCTVVPLIDFEHYGVEPPEGYYEGDEGPLAPPLPPKVGKAGAPPVPPVVVPKPPIAPPPPPVPPPEIPPVTTDPKVVGDLPKETAAKRAERRITEFEEKSKITAPKKSNQEFINETKERFGIQFKSGKYYDQEKVQLFLDSLDDLHRNLSIKVRKRLYKQKLLKIESSTPSTDIGSRTLGDYSERKRLLRINRKCRRTSEMTKWSPKIHTSELRMSYEWTSTHEYGHHIYYHGLTESQKKAWFKVWSTEPEKISLYATKNASEGFCESLAAYMKSPEALKQTSSEAYAFIEKYLMAGG